MNKLEAQAIIENTGNYDEDEIEEVLGVYETVLKHIGFEDKRRDNRFIVKFHDIFYYTPDECEEIEMDRLFEEFCEMQYEYVGESLNDKHIPIDEMLHPMYVGHYQGFVVDIPEITNENAIDLAMEIYDEFSWNGKEYVENYIEVVKILQDLEDNYMEYWINFLEDDEFMSQKTIDEIKNKYQKDMERRQAAKTLAK